MSINPNKSHFRKEANYIRGTLHSHACTHRGSNNRPHQDLPHVHSGQAHQHLQLANKGSVDWSGVCIGCAAVLIWFGCHQMKTSCNRADNCNIQSCHDTLFAVMMPHNFK